MTAITARVASTIHRALAAASGTSFALSSTMLRWVRRLSETQRTALADKVLDLANIAAGGMVFGQFLADRPFSVSLAVFGLACWLSLALNALRLIRGVKP